MNDTSPLISFVVLSWNTLNDTKICLENLRDQQYSSKEIIVVDNGSTDGSKSYLETLDDITYIDLPENTGFTGGQIAAYKKSLGEYIVLVNSDAVLSRDWASKALSVFQAHKNVAAVGGKAHEWNQADEAFDITLPFYSYQKIDLNLGYAATMRAGESRVEVDSISGAAVMISREAIEKIGYFDDVFFAYFEETDLFARFQRAGYKIVYEPSLHAWHQIAKSTKSKPYFYLFHMHRNRFMFAYKNFDHPARFIAEYTLDYLRARRRAIRSASLDDKARIDAYHWNMKKIYSISKRRVSMQHSYDSLIRSHRAGDDVTVIIPSYNYADYISDAIESVLNQTKKPTRIIVIDDGSTDESVRIAKKYSQVEVITKKNAGVIATKNIGVGLVTTSWSLFLDADDILEPNYIEEMLKESRKRSADVVYSDMVYFGSKTGVFKAVEFSVEKLTEGNFIHNSALINSSLLKAVGGYKPEMHGGYEDWELYLSLAEAGAVFAYCRDTHLKYRQHGSSLGRNNEATQQAEALLDQVRRLHSNLYSRTHRNRTWRVKLGRLMLKHPEVMLIALCLLPISSILAIRNYLAGVKNRTVHGTRAYIHNKEARQGKL